MSKELRIWIGNDIEERSIIKNSITSENYREMTIYKKPYMFPKMSKPFSKQMALDVMRKKWSFQLKSEIHVFEDGEFHRIWDVNMEKSDFDNDDMLKKLFIVFVSMHSIKTTFDINFATTAMQELDKAEKEHGLSIISGDHVDAVSIIGIVRREVSNSVWASIAKYIILYLSFLDKESLVDGIDQINTDFVSHNVKSTIFKKLTKKAILNFAKSQRLQMGILPILLFTGVEMGNRKNSFDETRRLKKSDITDNGIMITGQRERFLEIKDNDLLYYLKKARDSHQVTNDKFNSSPFVLNSESNRGELTKEYGITHMGYRYRLRKMQDSINKMLEFEEEDKITPNDIVKAGKLYYINKYIHEGISFEDAIFKTLVRFGDLGETSDPYDPLNIQKRRILKDFWKEVNSEESSM